MKVLHTISGLSVYGGGPSLSTLLTVKGLRQSGVDAEILTYFPEINGDALISTDAYIHAIKAVHDRRFAYSREYTKALHDMAASSEVLHAQGVWQYPAHITASEARRKGKPYVISLRGMLYPQAMKSSAWVKRLSMLLYQHRDLQQAACIHATCREEYEFYRQLGFTNPVVVIPNPIEVVDSSQISVTRQSRIRIGYLGRVHPRKRIERLLYAMAALGTRASCCELVVIGGGDKEYEAFLQSEAERLHLSNVRFTGFLSGQAKEEALQSLSYLFVPSDFENFGNIVTEALVRGIPVMASKGTPWEELNTYRCGWWVDNDVDTIASAMRAAIELPEAERRAMGERGRQLIINHYSVDVVAAQMKAVYEWLMGGVKPDCVYE